ncbi:hypothetical protein [Lysobacter sp. cf310]|uniref:hypothetical protein n=1 Tax=Lysobacter sp. cf310 TaxID=1761790 RepID=UPI0008E42ED3|nr:hypothetical protein [Lysobacter sp. cf310]SFK43718.1 hypothetical protein SAMN04487938_0829 [Lysobacter sp. cf310]
MRPAPWPLAWLLAGLALAPASASEPAPGVRLLTSAPTCAHRRLGQVSVTLGEKAPNLRTGMRPSPVDYRLAFDKLARAAQAKGGDAVVLRGHEAAYVAKGARASRRPSYVSLQGAVIALANPDAACELALLDPQTFAREVLAREAQDVVEETGIAF